MKKVDLCIFDLAGTTIKDDGGIVNQAFQKALSVHGHNFSEQEINQYMGQAKPIAIAKLLLPVLTLVPEKLVNSIHDTFVSLMIEHYATNPNVAEIPGTSETFDQLREKGIKVAVNTGFSTPITQAILDRTKWLEDGLVVCAISSDEVKEGRPAPLMIWKIMERLNLSNIHKVAKIGDTPADLMEGWNAGCGFVIGVCEGTHTKEQLYAYYHTHLVPNVQHVSDIVL